MWILVTLLLVITSAEVSRTNDGKVSFEDEQSDEEDLEQYDDDQQEFENEEGNLTIENLNLEKQSESHPPAFGPSSTNVLKFP
uniref:Uncharacterized protein n=1 Tax=Elaeophora elaphi TaxID=1147741 RepID=A0A0R3RN33_9BILA